MSMLVLGPGGYRFVDYLKCGTGFGRVDGDGRGRVQGDGAERGAHVAVVAFLAQHAHHEFAPGQALEAFPEFALQALGAVAVPHVQARGQRHEEVGVGVRHVFGAKALGVVLIDEARVEVAADEAGVRR